MLPAHEPIGSAFATPANIGTVTSKNTANAARLALRRNTPSPIQYPSKIVNEALGKVYHYKSLQCSIGREERKSSSFQNGLPPEKWSSLK